MFTEIQNSTIDHLDAAAKKLANHYSLYINSPFLKRTTSLIEISQAQRDAIKEFMRMINANLLYDLRFFYELELAFASYCDHAYYKIAPIIDTTLLQRQELRELNLTPTEHAMYQILVSSFPKNIIQLAQYTSDLYQITVDLDTNQSAAHKKRKPVYTMVEGIAQIDLLLLPILSEP